MNTIKSEEFILKKIIFFLVIFLFLMEVFSQQCFVDDSGNYVCTLDSGFYNDVSLNYKEITISIADVNKKFILKDNKIIINNTKTGKKDEVNISDIKGLKEDIDELLKKTSSLKYLEKDFSEINNNTSFVNLKTEESDIYLVINEELLKNNSFNKIYNNLKIISKK